MNLLRAAEFKVGLLVLAVASLIAYMSLQVSEDPSLMGRSNEAWFMLDNAGGLVKNSSVKMAGIPMGVIKDIKLQDGKARVELSMRPDVKMFVSAQVQLKSQGILGDSHVELSPGSPTDPPLPRGGQIVTVLEKGNLDNVLNQVGDVAANLKDVTKNLKEALSEDGTNKHILGRIVQNIEKLTKDISEMTAQNKGKIGEIIDQLNGITGTLDEALNDDSEEGFKEVWKRTITRIDSTMKNLDEITGKINRGEGTVGKLISDDEIADNVSHAIDGISDVLDSAAKLQTSFDVRSGYLGVANGAKTTLNIDIQPGIDRYYVLGVVSDPMGVVNTTSYVSNGTNPANYTQTTTYLQGYKLNAQFAKTFYDWTFRAGLIENYGGFGVDYRFLKGKAKASLEFNNFSSINMVPTLSYDIWKGVYVFGGLYDALNKSGNFSSYIGAGLFLTNDDLKMALTKIPL